MSILKCIQFSKVKQAYTYRSFYISRWFTIWTLDC